MKRYYGKFLRFYGQTEDAILSCLDALSAACPLIRGWVETNATRSVNLGVQAKEVRQFTALFDSEDDAESAMTATGLLKIYSAAACGPALKKFQRETIVQLPGSPAFEVGT